MASEDLYRGDWIVALRKDGIRRPDDPDGAAFDRWVFEHPGAVIVLAVDEDERVACVRQYRHPARGTFLELPAGLRDADGEDPLDTAKRELLEEVELEAADWRQLFSLWPSAGITAERHVFFLARGLSAGDRGDFALEHEEAAMEMLVGAGRRPGRGGPRRAGHRGADRRRRARLRRPAPPGQTVKASVTDLLREHPVIDGHNDLLWALRHRHNYDFDAVDIGERQDGLVHTDLPRLREGGVGAQFWSVYVPSTMGPEAVGATLEQVDAAYRMIERYADRMALATTADEVEAAWALGRVASLLGAEGGHQIDGSLAVLRMYHRLGVRYLTLTHNDNVAWADSATDERVLGGLNDVGRGVVAEMNRLGMMVDLSHVSAETMRDALDVSTAPVIFSHSSAYALVDHPRNVPDDVLTTMAARGGLCMVSFVPRFVSQANRDWALAAEDAARDAGIDPKELARFEPFLDDLEGVDPPPAATLADVVAHVEHVRDVAGIDHVGLGGDYDGVTTLPEGLEDVSRYPNLLEALAERGWSADDLGQADLPQRAADDACGRGRRWQISA